MGRPVPPPFMCLVPEACQKGTGESRLGVGAALGNADPEPPQARAPAEVKCYVKGVCSFFFSPQISRTAPVQGGTAHLPEPKKSSSMARL